jgi:hypothetical protein
MTTEPITMTLHKYWFDVIAHKHHRGTAMHSLSWRDVCYGLEVDDDKSENVDGLKIEISKVTKIRSKTDG